MKKSLRKKSVLKKCIFGVLLLTVPSLMTVSAQSKGRIPVVYCTDLFHPHQDPDDHLDLATLFSMSEFDVKAILLDQGKKAGKSTRECTCKTNADLDR